MGKNLLLELPDQFVLLLSLLDGPAHLGLLSRHVRAQPAHLVLGALQQGNHQVKVTTLDILFWPDNEPVGGTYFCAAPLSTVPTSQPSALHLPMGI
jgi:hypothetical protein